MKLTDTELATVLAALRTYQSMNENCGQPLAVHDIATDCGTLEPLGMDEIDALCERLNTQEVEL